MNDDQVRGDGPCSDCGTEDNPVWFTDSVLWNAVCRSDLNYIEPVLCIWCFVKRVEAKGFRPIGWRVLAEWPWVGPNERGEVTSDTQR